jgi:hypothetical protein
MATASKSNRVTIQGADAPRSEMHVARMRLWIPQRLAFFGLLLPWLAGSEHSSAADRYVALFEDGARVTSAELKDWNDPQAQPRVGDRWLFEPSRPFRWVIDRQQWPTEPPTAFVEFVGGDRLPGELVGFQTGREGPFEQLPPHVLVRPTSELQPPDDPDPGVVRVLADSLRRVAWQHRPTEDYRPATAFLRNGGELAFRSARWTPGGVALLLDGGVKEFAFSDLDELHLPQRDPWAAYAAEVAVLSPDLQARCLQWDTLDGGRFTASTVRFSARHWGDRNRPEAWLHLLQPAWSLDPLWLRFRTVHTWRSWDADEPPLNRFGPQTVRHTAVFGQGWKWRSDRSTQGRRLQIGAAEFASGFGVHATTDLVFDWPPCAQHLRVMCGLDQTAGPRGCVTLSIVDDQQRTLFQRERLVGSLEVIHTNWLTPQPAADASPRQITLRADMAADNRPSGADPFDIRDAVAWGDPQVRWDETALRSMAAQHALAAIPGLTGWTASAQDAASLRLVSQADVTDPRDPSFRTLFRTVEPFVVLSRSLKIGSDDRWLSLVVARFSEHAASSVQLKLDGVSLGEYEMPVRQGPIDPEPVLVPLSDELRGRTARLDVVVYPTAETSFVDLHGVALTSLRPGVRRLYEDEEAAATALAGELPGVESSMETPFTGDKCLRVPPGPPAELALLPGGEALVVELPKLGQYRYIGFAWRGDNTSGLSLQLAHDGRLGTRIAEALAQRPGGKQPVRLGSRNRKLEDRGLRHGYAYDTGNYQPLVGSPLRLDRNVPSQWKLETRDLFGDFGAMTLTGFTVQCLERGAGWFDHIYLARTPQDLDFVRSHLLPTKPPPPDATYSQKATKPEEWGPAIASFAPAFATNDAPHGVLQKREHFGQSDGWQTHPKEKDQPFVLRTGLHLPNDVPQELDLRVSHQPQRDWRLVVQVNGQRIHEQLIDDQLTSPQRGWASLQVDLSVYRGQKVLLEVLNESNNWDNEHAIWKRVVVRDKP